MKRLPCDGLNRFPVAALGGDVFLVSSTLASFAISGFENKPYPGAAAVPKMFFFGASGFAPDDPKRLNP